MNKDKKICYCFNVTVGDLQTAINEGADSVESVKSKTHAGMGCGRCNARLEEVVDELLKNENN